MCGKFRVLLVLFMVDHLPFTLNSERKIIFGWPLNWYMFRRKQTHRLKCISGGFIRCLRGLIIISKLTHLGQHKHWQCRWCESQYHLMGCTKEVALSVHTGGYFSDSNKKNCHHARFWIVNFL